MKIFNSKILMPLGIFLVAFFFRIIWQGSFPPGFAPDEGAFGYDAYSILKTGKDQYGNSFPVVFKSFGDYKAPLYFYLTVISEFFFGLNKIAVRLPSIFLGSATCVLVYFFVNLLWKKKNFALISGLLLAISPWHLLHSRFSAESVVSLFFLMTGLLFFFLWLKQKMKIALFLSAGGFVFSVYAYHSARLTSFLLLLTLCLIYRKELSKRVKEIILPAIFGIIIVLPLLMAMITKFDELMRRPMAISIFNDEGLKGRLWELTHVNANISLFFTRIFNNKPLIYLLEISRRWLHHFDLNYLFVNGDPFDRFQTPYAGLISIFALPFFFIGLFNLLKKITKKSIFLLVWIGISPIVSSMTVYTPNSSHTFDSTIPFVIIIALGVNKLLLGVKNKASQIALLSIIFIVFLIPFAYSYIFVIPAEKENCEHWGFGFEQVIKEVSKIENKYEKIVFFGGANFDLALFFQKYPPEKFQREFVYKSADDKKLYDRIESYGEYFFPEDEKEILKNNKDSLIIFGGNFIENLSIKDKKDIIFYNSSLVKNKKFKVNKIIFFPDGSISYALVEPI